MHTRRLLRFLAGAGLAVFLLIAAAAPAWAHATLVSSSPPKDGEVDVSPKQIELRFNENVEVSIGGVRLYNCSGARITVGAPRHINGHGSEVGVTVDSTLAPGIYVVDWRVISADSHPVQSAFSFRVGVGPSPSVSGCASTGSTKSSATVGVLFGTMRFLLFAGLALLVGGVVFLVLIARATEAASRLRVQIWTGWVAAVLATIFGVMLQGPYAEGAGIGDALKWSIVKDILDTRYGHIAEFRLLLLAVALPLLLTLSLVDGPRLSMPWVGLASVVGVLLCATPGLAGHASTGDNVIFAVPFDTLHVLAMCIWLGGLVALILSALTFRSGGRLRRVITLFSLLAFWCVVVLVVTGLFASWRQVGFTLDGYLHTSYGNILLVKLAIVVALVALAAVSRSIVHKHQRTPEDAPDSVTAAVATKTQQGLRRSVGVEVALGVAVLIVTAILVNAQPARTALEPKLFTGSAIAGSGDSAIRIETTIDPARVGPNTIHLYTLTLKGADLVVRNITANLYNPKTKASVPIDLHRGGPNHFLVNGQLVTDKGPQQMIVHVTRGEFGDSAASFNVNFR
jgi:copper transport protein